MEEISMKNEEKTKQLVCDKGCTGTYCEKYREKCDVFNAVMEMAEWKEKQMVELWNVASNVYKAWMGGTMNDVRECMKDLGHVYDEFKDMYMEE